MADSYYQLGIWQLGLLAEQWGQPGQRTGTDDSVRHTFRDTPHPMSGPGPDHRARLTAQLGMDALEACWREVNVSPLSQAVCDYNNSSRPGTGSANEAPRIAGRAMPPNRTICV
jgi:hypothetical protein